MSSRFHRFRKIQSPGNSWEDLHSGQSEIENNCFSIILIQHNTVNLLENVVKKATADAYFGSNSLRIIHLPPLSPPSLTTIPFSLSQSKSLSIVLAEILRIKPISLAEIEGESFIKERIFCLRIFATLPVFSAKKLFSPTFSPTLSPDGSFLASYSVEEKYNP